VQVVVVAVVVVLVDNNQVLLLMFSFEEDHLPYLQLHIYSTIIVMVFVEVIIGIVLYH